MCGVVLEVNICLQLHLHLFNMKVVIQRVKKALVEVENNTVGEISDGLFLLLGIHENDTREKAKYLVDKILKMRILPDHNQKMNRSVIDTKSSLLVVSQFTLHADTSAGNRPSFIQAADPEKAKEIYDYFIDELKVSGLNIQTGKFGAYMKINADLDGPVTIILER